MRPLDLGKEPTLKIGKMKGTVARHITFGLGLRLWKWRLWLVILTKEVRLGNWKFKEIHEGMKPLTDEELTITALNEEYLHEAIYRAESMKASKLWDNLSFDIRAFINGSFP